MSDPHETNLEGLEVADEASLQGKGETTEGEEPSLGAGLEALLGAEIEEGPAPDSGEHGALDDDGSLGIPEPEEEGRDPREDDDEDDVVETWNDPDQGTADVARAHAKGLLEALVFVSDGPVKVFDLAKTAGTSVRGVRELLGELQAEYGQRGIRLDEVAGGWVFRTSAAYAPYIRELTKQKPVKLTRAQVETLAILAYRQPITRPEIDDIRGVDAGAVLKVLLERDLIKILGKKDEPGRPILYGTTSQFLALFGLASLKDLPTLREFTELSDDSKRVVERELGDALEAAAAEEAENAAEPAVTVSAADLEDPDPEAAHAGEAAPLEDGHRDEPTPEGELREESEAGEGPPAEAASDGTGGDLPRAEPEPAPEDSE